MSNASLLSSTAGKASPRAANDTPYFCVSTKTQESEANFFCTFYDFNKLQFVLTLNFFGSTFTYILSAVSDLHLGV